MIELAIWLALLLGAPAPSPWPGHEPPETVEPQFARDVQPILERRCQPCHFPGGVMHKKLPFDRAETIETLGERLFTRIKAEEEREVIRRFLALSKVSS